MAETKRLSDRNKLIQELLTNGKGLMNFYRFVAQNPHINLHDACQIVINRPNASVCFLFSEWNEMDRRIIKGRKGIPYYDENGNKRFAFDKNDTWGKEYRRPIYPMGRMLKGLQSLTGAEFDEIQGDYWKIKVGVVNYLNQNDMFSEEDEARNRVLIDGISYSLYCRTGFPKDLGLTFYGMPYSLNENAELFKEIVADTETLLGEIEEAYNHPLQEKALVDDTEEETVSDEPILPIKDPKYVEIHSAAQSNYKGYLLLVHYTDLEKQPTPEELYLGKPENYEIGKYDNSDNSLIFVSNNPKMFSLMRGDGFTLSQQEMVEKGYFTEQDYKEFYELHNGLLKDFERERVVKFGMNVNDDNSGVPFKYPNWKVEPKKPRSNNALYNSYMDAQEEYPNAVVIIRLGDFYEIFGENAKVISGELKLVLTGRDVGLDSRIPMVGFPYSAADRYVEKILENHSVVVVESGEEPKYILSHAEARKDREKPYLIEVSEEESAELGDVFDEEEKVDEPVEVYDGEIDEEYEDDDETEDFEGDDEDEEEVEEKPQPKEKQGKPIKERKRKEKPQISLFDLMDENTKEPTYKQLQEQMLKRQLKRGSGFEHGKFRIYEKYQKNPSINEFAEFLKKEYGLGGYGSYGDSQHHDAKGIKMTWQKEDTRELIAEAFLKWNDVAVHIGDLIDDNEYFTEKEKGEYAVILAKRNARINAKTDGDRLKVIARQFIDEETKRTWNGRAELQAHKFEESAQFVREHQAELEEILKAEPEIKGLVKTDYPYLHYIGVEFYPEYCPRIEIEETSDQKKIKGIVETIVKDGTEETQTMSWMTYYDEFEDDEQFVKEHKDDIENGLLDREEVASVETFDDGISVVFYADYCKHGNEIMEENGDDLTPKNTSLDEIGLDQTALGGAKSKFRSNIEAIRLMERLYVEKREPTTAEKLTLAKYVGWGGLAKAFDEKDENWQKEYKELKETLSTDDYANARASVLSAYYTPKEVIEGMYSALERFGVKSNNKILEPAMGTGNFFGYMPKGIAENAKLYGVELDEITGKIATKLYPNANVQIKGFEQTTFPNNHFDIVVGNVPFGQFGVFDSDYAKENFYIHEYFIAKSIDKLKPNGIMAVITSAGTMDKRSQAMRKYVADRAELIGAIRLPNTAFKQIAGTEVVADILFFQKREEKIYADGENTKWLASKELQDGYLVNEYFHNHPEMVLGTFKEEIGMYGAKDLTVIPDGRDLKTALMEAIEKLPANFYTNPEYSLEEEAGKVEVDYTVKPTCYKAENGKLYMRMGDEMVEQDIPKHPQDAYERIRGMIELRGQLRHVLDIQSGGCSDEKLAEEQKILNANYDKFVKKYGYLNSSTNKRLFKDDGDSALVFACENYSEEKKTATKTDIFHKRTIRPYAVPTSTNDCFEALQISKNERGSVDISYIEELTGKDYDTILSELGATVYRNPVEVNPEDKYSGFETSEEYLSGKVVQKLNIAKRYASEFPNMGYERNVKALEQVQPTPIPASDISVKVGTNWIDKQYYVQFLFQLLRLPRYYYPDGITIFYNSFDSSWRVDVGMHVRRLSEMNVKSVYGTNDAGAYRLFEDLLNSRATTIYDVIEENGKERRVVNQAKTIAAREKQNKIQQEFKAWIFNDPERREDLERVYNARFNQVRLPTYDGSYLKFPEMNPTIELRPHQKNAVHRIITSGNTLLHHVVGSGKTYTVVSAAMKLRQYGLAKKPMIVVPNHLVEQWADSFRVLYPSANILVAHKEDLAKDNRERFVSKVAMGDWDSIIIAQSTFAKIPISKERQIKKINEEIYKIDQTIAHLWENSERPQGAVKNLERIKKNRKKLLEKLMDDSKKDDLLIFEKLGVDYLFVDEAHAYKNLALFTKMNNVSGISKAASARASDMQLKCEYINELHGGDKGVVFATGTPISNSMAEMYTLQTYLQNQTLQETGITFFDGWAANFGETVTALEMAPSGKGYKAKTRFAKFTNLPELLTMYHAFADVQTADMVKLDVPTVDKKVVALKPTETVLRLADEIAERAERIHDRAVDVHVDNMLKVTSDGKKVALDPRVYDRACADEQDSKINACVERVFEIWERTTDNKGVQLIFCDLSTPKKAFKDYEHGQDFDVYNDIKYKLVQRGIPAEEIAFIHDANTDAQKMSLYKDANAGKVRVFIGSTEKCGAGMNVQQRLFALHHLDTPYRPLDLQQREGRIIRQGNSYKNVEIYTYVTERTFDSYSYQILENKQRFISQIERGDMTIREAEDIDETTLSYAEIKAITAANPRIKRKMEVDTEIQRLRVLESEYRKSLYSTQDKVRKFFPDEIRRQTLYLENVRKDIETIKLKYNPDPEQFSINVLGKVYTDKVEGGRALMDALNSHKPETVVAEYAGFKISLNPMSMLLEARNVSLTGAGQYKMEIGDSEVGLLRRLDNFMKDFPERESRAKNKLTELEKNLKVAQSQLDVPFEHADELESLLKEQAELNAELDLNKRDEVVIEETEDGESGGEDETYMSVPEQDKVTQKKKQRKPFGKSQKAIYDKIKGKSPNAYVFVNNGGRYEIMGDYTAELGGTLETGEYTVTSLDGEELDKVIRSIVDRGYTVKIIDEYEEIKEEVEFLDKEDKVASMEIDLMPDTTIDQDEMHKYGYQWDGMLPLRRRSADRLRELGLTVHKLYSNDTESEYDGEIKENEPKLIYGIEKPDWKAFIESKDGRAYLYARLAMCKSGSRVVYENLSYVDEKFTINFGENNFLEKAVIEGYFFEKEKPSAEEMRKFIPNLLREFTERIHCDELLYYGWVKYDVASALADNLEPDELLEEANRVYDDWKLREFIDEHLPGIEELNGKMQGFSKEEVSMIIEKMNDTFIDSKWDRSYDDEVHYKTWYKQFSQERLLPILNERLFDVDKEIDKMMDGMTVDETLDFLGLDKVKAFEYGGYHFIPERQFTEAENDFNAISKKLRTDIEMGLCKKGYAYESKYDYSYKDFYESSTDKECDLFRCVENGKLYLPCENDLQEYIETQNIDYENTIKEIVDSEFKAFQEELLKKPSVEVFQKNYEIYVKTEFLDAILSTEMDEEYYVALYQDKDKGILQQLYEDFLGADDVSVETYGDVIEFVEDYCKYYHKDIIEGIQTQPKDENVVYLGERGNTAYYYFKDKLGYQYDEPRIKKEADEYIIAAPVCYLSQTYLEEHNITYLKVGRDIDESVLNPEMEIKARREMDKAYNRKFPLEATRISTDCKRDIEQYIRSHFNGMRLDMEYFDDLVEHYGLERMRYVLANTVQLNETDGRYSPQNKEWAKAVVINNEEKDRRLFNVESHPAIVDGVITAFRKIEKENVNYTRIEIDNGYGQKVTIRPDITLPFFKDMVKGNSYGLGIRLFEVVQEDGKDMLYPFSDLTKSFDEFIGIKNAAYVDTNNCPFAKQFLEKGIAKDTGFTRQSGRWEYPLWVFDEKFLRQSGEEAYAKYAKQYEENEDIKEGQEMPQEKREWVTVKVSQNAVIKRYDKHSFMRMPTGYYGDCTYNVYNDRMKRSTQITDLQSDSRELCYELKFDKAENVVLKNQNGDETVLSFEKFKEIVDGTTNADYEFKNNDGDETKWFTSSVPNDALLNMGEKASLFTFPNGTGLEKYSFYIPNTFVKEDTESDDGRIEISIPSDLRITAKDKDGNAIEITPYQVYSLLHNTENEQYVRQKTKTEYEESKAKPQVKSEVKQDDEGGWKYVSVPESAKISEYGDSTLFRMPTSGDYNGYAYFIPNKLLKANEEKGTIRISLPDGFIVKAKNNRADKKEEKKVEFQAEDFVAMVKDKGDKDYESYQKPSDEDVFKERETSLVESLPQEMKDRPNWVAIKTWYNEKRGKVEKRPIDCNTGEYADSVNPATWTTFDKARAFVKEKGYTTIAYALDGKDGICCIDLDGCLDDNGNYSALANQVMRKCGKTYMELSVSGKGLHIFGKTKGMDVRSFSKDGDMEFYQEGRFISMTGDGASYYALESFDTPEMKELILRKCEKRGEIKGQGQGVEGLSTMTDRDVVEKACADKKHGATFKALYEGQDLQNNHSNSDMSLMNRLAFWCNGDKEQMLRIFATSGLYRPEKSDGYYEGTAIKAVRDTTSRYSVKPKIPPTSKTTNGSGKGGK